MSKPLGVYVLTKKEVVKDLRDKHGMVVDSELIKSKELKSAGKAWRDSDGNILIELDMLPIDGRLIIKEEP